jgi:hypothetical protein
MSVPSVVPDDVLEAALDAAVRHHFELRHSAGLCVPFEQIGAASRAVVRRQLRGQVQAVLDEIGPRIWREEATTVERWCPQHSDPMPCPHGVMPGPGTYCQPCEDELDACRCEGGPHGRT